MIKRGILLMLLLALSIVVAASCSPDDSETGRYSERDSTTTIEDKDAIDTSEYDSIVYSPDGRVNTFVRRYNASNPERILEPSDVFTTKGYGYMTDIDLDHMHVCISYVEDTNLYLICTSDVEYSADNQAAFLEDARHVLQGMYGISEEEAGGIIDHLTEGDYPYHNFFKQKDRKQKASFMAGVDGYSNTFEFTTGDYVSLWDDYE